jgi:hypothetical protein
MKRSLVNFAAAADFVLSGAAAARVRALYPGLEDRRLGDPA